MIVISEPTDLSGTNVIYEEDGRRRREFVHYEKIYEDLLNMSERSPYFEHRTRQIADMLCIKPRVMRELENLPVQFEPHKAQILQHFYGAFGKEILKIKFLSTEDGVYTFLIGDKRESVLMEGEEVRYVTPPVVKPVPTGWKPRPIRDSNGIELAHAMMSPYEITPKFQTYGGGEQAR
jgi:hypothetical protein